MVFSVGLSIIGYAMYLTSTSKRVKYASLFFSVSSAYAAPSGAFAWVVRDPHVVLSCQLNFMFL